MRRCEHGNPSGYCLKCHIIWEILRLKLAIQSMKSAKKKIKQLQKELKNSKKYMPEA